MTASLRKIVVAVILVGAVGFMSWRGLHRRLAVVDEFRNYAGDGWQYFHLAEQLVKNKRYAFAPAPVPPAFSRLPGYPVFIAWVAHNIEPFDPDRVAREVVRVQCWIDMLCVLFAFLLAREAGLRAPPWLAFALCVASPFLATCTAYILTETVAICLSTATLWLLLRARRKSLVANLAVAGALVGLGMLVRADAVTLVPCFAVPLYCSTATRRQKVKAAALAGGIALAIFGVWPARNLVRFHAPHTFGAAWVSRQGDPLPTGVMKWTQTWAVEPRDASLFAWPMTRGNPIYGPLPIACYDNVDERNWVQRLVDEYNRAGMITPGIDEQFQRLARERTTRNPKRQLWTLSGRRLKALWLEPMPEWEMPITAKELQLPQQRESWKKLHDRTIKLALLGLLVLLLFRAGRPLASLALIAAASRTLAVLALGPGGTPRYLLELLPLELALAAIALTGPAELILCHLAGRRPEVTPSLR